MTASLAVAVFALAIALLTAVPAAIHSAQHRARHDALAQVRDDASRAIARDQSIENRGCNPGAGAGSMGVCAPTQAMAASNILGHALGDPADVRSLGPIGVDVSNNNGCGFSLAAHHAAFVWAKVGEGTYFTDACARGFHRQAAALHIPGGGYEFVRPGRASAQAEAAAFAHRLQLAGFARSLLPPVADVEVNDRGLSPSALNAWACAFVKAARGYLHRRVDVYTGYWFWHGSSCGADLWEAAYAPNPIVPAGWAHKGWRTDVTTWQHSDGRFGPAPHLGADTDVMLHPERYGLRVVRGRLVKKQPAKPKPTPKPATGKARAHLLLEHRHIVAQLRARHCARHRSRGDCKRLYRHNATVHALLGR